jgi:hypothetical protein
MLISLFGNKVLEMEKILILPNGALLRWIHWFSRIALEVLGKFFSILHRSINSELIWRMNSCQDAISHCCIAQYAAPHLSS